MREREVEAVKNLLHNYHCTELDQLKQTQRITPKINFSSYYESYV